MDSQLLWMSEQISCFANSRETRSRADKHLPPSEWFLARVDSLCLFHGAHQAEVDKPECASIHSLSFLIWCNAVANDVLDAETIGIGGGQEKSMFSYLDSCVCIGWKGGPARDRQKQMRTDRTDAKKGWKYLRGKQFQDSSLWKTCRMMTRNGRGACTIQSSIRARALHSVP